MDMAPPGDQISRLLHVVVIEICQRIVSYTDELVVSGMVFVKADGVQVCRVTFEDALKGKDRATSSDDPQAERSQTHEENQKPLLIGSDFNGDRVGKTPPGFPDDGAPRANRGTISPAVNNSSMGISPGGFLEGCETYKHALRRKELFPTNGTIANGSRVSSAANLGEMVLEYWQQITPELLKASALLHKLGELQQTIDAQSISLADLDKKPRCRQFCEGDCGSDRRARSFMERTGPDHRIRNQCRLCQKVFTFATNLRRHQRNFHGRPSSRDVVRTTRGVFGGAGLQMGVGSHRTNSVVFGERLGHLFPRKPDNSEAGTSMPSAEVVDREAESKEGRKVDGFSGSKNSKSESGSSSAAPEVCPEEELEVCDIRAGEEEVLGEDGVDHELSARKGFVDRQKVFDKVDAVGAGRAVADAYAFDDCWDKSGDSMLDPISVDVSDDNSVHYLEDCCSLDGSSGPATSGCVGDALMTDDGSFHKALITDTITVGSPDSVRSVEVEESRMKKFKCLLCDASFSMSNNLQRHVKKIHSNSKDNDRMRKAPAFQSAVDALNCVESTGEFKTARSSRYRHICVMCGAAFTFRTNLTRHMKKIHHQIPLDASPVKPRDQASPRP